MRSPESLVLTFLVNALWQAPLLAAAAWLGARLLGHAPAAFRHRLWVAALALSLLLPIVSTLRPSTLAVEDLVGRSRWGAAALDSLRPGDVAGHAEKRALAARARQNGALRRATAIGYGLLVLTLSVRLWRGWWRTLRIAAEAQPAPASLAAIAADCASPDVVHAVELRVSRSVATPMTVGIRRPVIVVAQAFAGESDPQALRGVLAHELAHVRRGDCAVNLLCELLALPLGFHPVTRLLRRRIAGARETACDEAAVSLVGARSYASTLLEAASFAARRPTLSGALGVLDGHCLEDRMKRILETRARSSRWSSLALFCMAIGILALAARGAAAAAVQVESVPGPGDMVGKWKAQFAEGPLANRPAADLAIALGPNGPEIDLTLYRYQRGSAKEPAVEHPPVVEHHVAKGVLYFRTRAKIQARPGEPAESTDVDWEFTVVGTDAGQLRVHNPKLAAERDSEPEPLPMRRVP